VKPPASQRASAWTSAAVLARSVLHAGSDLIRALRQSPGPALGTPLPANFLKHADDQTVLGIAAVLRAAHAFGLAETDFHDWGVLAAPRFLARSNVATALKRFQQEGAWGVSPHLIPHRSLHSVSGTVSQALNLHGPNFGVGGGPESAATALLAAAAMLQEETLPGVWLILTGWNWEPGPDLLEPGDSAPASCSAVAMALIPATPSRGGCCWRISGSPVTGDALSEPGATVLSLESVCDALECPGASATSWRLPCGGAAILESVEAVAEKRA
jgi:hypothetical protein